MMAALSASPRRLFLHSWTVSSQSFKAVVTFVKNFRWAHPGVHVRTDTNPIFEGYDVGWYFFSNIPSICTGYGMVKSTGDPRIYKILISLELILILVGTFIHHLAMYSIIYWFRDMPFRLIGAKAKFMIELIPIIMLAALHHFFEFNYGYLSLVVGFTTYFYIIAHFMHVAYDIEGKDVLLGLVMQVLAYLLNGELLFRALGLSFCVVLCFYRYVMYSTPELPHHRKKELERLPC
ncbi:hypothetical protein AABB24_016583 [Solanum stoloniferum]